MASETFREGTTLGNFKVDEVFSSVSETVRQMGPLDSSITYDTKNHDDKFG